MRGESGARVDRAVVRGMAVVAATYFAFLLFAQFAFVEILQRELGDSGVRQAMLSMGVAGLLGSAAAGLLLGRLAAHRVIGGGFLLTAASATVATMRVSSVGMMVVAAAIGLGVSLLTVGVAAELRRLIPGPALGLRVGVATGVAYLACNLPPLFNAEAELQAVVVAGVCLAGVAVVPRLPHCTASSLPPAERAASSGGPVFAALLISLLALVWLDSAAFNVIQETLALKGQTWGSPGRLLLQGGAHLVAAVAAGVLIDRRQLPALPPLTFALFATSFLLLAGGQGLSSLGGPLYAVGISLYSVALVALPTYQAGFLEPRWRAATLFGIAGWVGSALGVGMAMDLHTIPPSFLLLGGIVITVGWLVTRSRAVTVALRGLAPTMAWAAVAAVWVVVAGGFAPFGPSPQGSVTDPERVSTSIARGRAVYVREGCINCHSQFVRPGTHDEELWGPLRERPAEENPPLIGMRRQGPDLMNVGNRRSALWQKLHLIAPRRLSPGSRMPSYAYLFEGGDGDDLVAYLSSLGFETARERFEYSQTAVVGSAEMAGSETAGAELFAQHCLVCHGPEGRGDGPFGALIGRPAMNLRKGSFWLVPYGPGAGSESEGLARVIRFGIPGTSMPGHEYLADQQVADLVVHVTRLVRGPVDEPSRVATVSSSGDGDTLE